MFSQMSIRSDGVTVLSMGFWNRAPDGFAGALL